MMMRLLLLQVAPLGVQVDTQLSFWQIIGFVVVSAMAWGAALYRIDSHGKAHVRHFAHAGDLTLHQTPAERAAVAEAVTARFDAHEKLDVVRFGQLDSKVDVMQEDIKEILRRVAKP